MQQRCILAKFFFEVQKEIFKGGWFCEVKDLGEEDGWEIFEVIHKNQKHEVKATYNVFFIYLYRLYIIMF